MTRLNFIKSTKSKAYDRAMSKGGLCECGCGAPLQPPNIEYDHVLPCALGGDGSLANCMVMTKACHARKTAKQDVPAIRKADRQKAKHIGATTPSKTPIPQRPKPERTSKPPVLGKTELQRRYGQ